MYLNIYDNDINTNEEAVWKYILTWRAGIWIQLKFDNIVFWRSKQEDNFGF